MRDSSLMWKCDWEFSQASCDRCVKSTTYINREKSAKKCTECGHETSL